MNEYIESIRKYKVQIRGTKLRTDGKVGGDPKYNQVAVDEQGRRRFHGAFTGGFSAGYYNTVGSEEGFTPRQFHSSRTKRATMESIVPEEYMDDEDLMNVARIGSTLTISPQFASKSSNTTISIGDQLLMSHVPTPSPTSSAAGPTVPNTSWASHRPNPSPSQLIAIHHQHKHGLGYESSIIRSDRPHEIGARVLEHDGVQQLDYSDHETQEYPVLRRRKRHKGTRSTMCTDGSTPLNGFRVGNTCVDFWKIQTSLLHFAPLSIPQDFDGSHHAAEEPLDRLPTHLAAFVRGMQTKLQMEAEIKNQALVSSGSMKEELTEKFRIGSAQAMLNFDSETAPFSNDRDKEARFDAFKKLKSSQTPLASSTPLHVSDETWTHEMRSEERREFDNVYDILHPHSVPTMEHIEVSSEERAAQQGRYGPLTRTKEPWTPHPLLCRRFHLQIPDLPILQNDAPSHDTMSSELNTDKQKHLPLPPFDLFEAVFGPDMSQSTLHNTQPKRKRRVTKSRWDT